MSVKFSDTDGFLDDLRKEPGVKLVRIDNHTQQVNDGATDVFLTASYMVGDEVRKLVTYCGTNYEWADQTGTEELNRQTTLVAEACSELEIELRPGEFD